ncbi:MAG: ABC transporter permease [Candidatus Dormibacteraeota bacterium]|nr:ABC transporter permease [Candidatus Dormibacteraeota bacterium]
MATVVTPLGAEYEGGILAREQVSLWRDGLRRLRRNRFALVAACYLIFIVGVALVAFVWTPYDPKAQNICQVEPVFADAPSAQHLFGCDPLGRDILSQMMQGAQISLAVGVGTALIVLVGGVSLGMLAGYRRGWIDSVISLVINVFYSVPTLLFALILYIILGPGLVNIMIAISVTTWMDMARLVRGQTLSIREREYIEAARASGTKSGRMLIQHVFPNALGPIIVQATFVIPIAILTEAFLSFLGLGIRPPLFSWGAIASGTADGTTPLSLLQGGAAHIVLFPSAALSLTLLAFNFFGDGLRDAFDPRQKR